MSDNQARYSRDDDVYDHEHEEPRSGRRRRPVADWGVGEDVFEHMPRNRFSRAAEGPPRERRFSSRDAEHRERAAAQAGEPATQQAGEPAAPQAGERAAPPAAEPAAPQAGERAAPPAGEPAASQAGERAAPQDDVPRGQVKDGRRTLVIGRPEDVPSEIAAITADRDLGEPDAPGADAAAPEQRAGEPPRAGERPQGAERRTVRIGGRPEGSLEAARFHREHGRRRPPRSAHERVGARPERLAMWAVALGLLLIVIAILTAS